jgi:hypothetical protein
MIRVHVQLPGDSLNVIELRFLVPPRNGETLALRIDGKRKWFRVADVEHIQLSDSRAKEEGCDTGLMIWLKPDELPRRWTSADDYSK